MSRLRFAAAVAVLGTLSATATATAALPLPPHPVGSGHEPLSAHAVVFGRQVRIRSGLVWYDGFGDVSLLLSPRQTTCAAISARRKGSYVLAWMHSTGPVLQAGNAVRGVGPLRVVVSFSSRGGSKSASITKRVELRVTRIDTRARGVWHGALQVPATRAHGSRFAFAGTFAARWCGKR